MQLDEVGRDRAMIWLLLLNAILTGRHTELLEHTRQMLYILWWYIQVFGSVINTQIPLNLLFMERKSHFTFNHTIIFCKNTQKGKLMLSINIVFILIMFMRVHIHVCVCTTDVFSLPWNKAWEQLAQLW